MNSKIGIFLHIFTPGSLLLIIFLILNLNSNLFWLVGSTSNDFVIAFQVQNDPSSSAIARSPSAIARKNHAKSPPEKKIWHKPHRLTCEELEKMIRNYKVRPGLKQLARKVTFPLIFTDLMSH